MELKPVAPIAGTLAVRAADDITSLEDLRSIARRIHASKAFAQVVFPYRDGDTADVHMELRLRQTSDMHRTANVFKNLAIGLSLFVLSPFVGTRLTEIHDVRVRFFRGERLIGHHQFQAHTDLTLGMAAEPESAGKDLDEQQMNQIALRLIELLQADWHRIRDERRAEAQNDRSALSLRSP